MLSVKEYAEATDNSKVYDAVSPTALTECPNLSNKTDNRVFMKREDQQPVFSFKIRGAFNKIAHLSKEELDCGIVTSSAGNHAQGVGFSGQFFGCKTLIVMPISTPSIKINAVKARGAEVVLHGDSYQEAYNHAREIEKERGLVFVHPFDDPLVIAGQGTIAKEILADLKALKTAPDYVFVPIGGGGIASGVGAYLKTHSPATKLIGVHSEESASMLAAFEAGQIVTLDWVGSFADGVAVKRVGEETFRICREVVDEIITVSTDEICSAIKDCFEDTRVLMEPSGALSTAGLKKYVKEQKLSSKTLVTIACGANVNFDRLSHIAERTEYAEDQEIILAVDLPEKPSSLKSFCAQLSDHNVTEFNYRYSHNNTARVFLGIGMSSKSGKEKLLANLKDKGFNFQDLSQNELAKTHIRHMIGGHAPENIDEFLYRFEFPERAGALGQFLDVLPSSWNISMFHYRSHGSDRGRVLIGLQVPKSDQDNIDQILSESSYAFWNETENPAYSLFLG